MDDSMDEWMDMRGIITERNRATGSSQILFYDDNDDNNRMIDRNNELSKVLY